MIKRLLKTLGCLAVSALLILLDQWVKLWVYNGIRINGPIVLIPGVLQFGYVENYGAAFNILTDRRWLLVVFACLVSAVLLVMLFLSFREKQLTSGVLLWERACLVMILAGAVGNVIDRVQHVYVIDFIETLFIDFPLFNVADSLIVVGCILLFILVFFSEEKQEPAENNDAGAVPETESQKPHEEDDPEESPGSSEEENSEAIQETEEELSHE
ncbi:MAG: signal peptidase II [Lachnospiraceae bacterium]|nr:signal peptidase II [Lachnospiraceae bacterium]